MRPLHSIPPSQQPLPHHKSRWLLPIGQDPDHTRSGRTRLRHIREDDHNIQTGGRLDLMRRRSIDKWSHCLEQPTRSGYRYSRFRSDGLVSDMDWKEDQGSQCDGRAIASQSVASGYNDALTARPIL